MPIAQSLIAELDHEFASTRKMLERVPVERFDWKPHPKSYSLGELATHIANLPTWGPTIIQESELDLAVQDRIRDLPKSSQELVAFFDGNVAKFRPLFEATTDETFMEPWTLRSGSHVVFTLPKVAVYRVSVMNHMIHHRAQLGVYLRLNDVPLPAIYGPTADEA